MCCLAAEDSDGEWCIPRDMSLSMLDDVLPRTGGVREGSHGVPLQRCRCSGAAGRRIRAPEYVESWQERGGPSHTDQSCSEQCTLNALFSPRHFATVASLFGGRAA